MPRLASGVRKKGNLFEKRFTYEKKRYSVYAPTQKELAIKEQELREQLKNKLYTNNRNITLDKYFLEWIKARGKSVKSTSVYTYDAVYRKRISPELGKKRVSDIERREIIALQDKLSEELKPTTANYVINELDSILASACADNIIIKNPCDGVKQVKETEKATETIHRALTNEEQAAFVEELKSSFYYEFIAFMLCTGARCGEVAALTWGNIDYKNDVIHITKTTTIKDGSLEVGDTTKTRASKRDIPLLPNTRKILAQQRDKLQGIINLPNKRIFGSYNGDLVRSRMINSEIKSTLARLEEKGTHIDYFSSHALRDTFATRFIEQGGTIQTLKTILGHESYSMTADLYAHVLPNTKREELERVNIVI